MPKKGEESQLACGDRGEGAGAALPPRLGRTPRNARGVFGTSARSGAPEQCRRPDLSQFGACWSTVFQSKGNGDPQRKTPRHPHALKSVAGCPVPHPKTRVASGRGMVTSAKSEGFCYCCPTTSSRWAAKSRSSSGRR